MPVSLEKPGGALTAQHALDPMDRERLREAILGFRRLQEALRSMVLAVPSASRNLRAPWDRAPQDRMADMFREAGVDPSVSPDAMRWTPPDTEVPR